jgi:hypothetical protein
VFISGSKTIIGTTSITGSLLVTGSLNTVGTITATTLVVQTITSSISSITGSTNFGSLSSNTHTFTGSINASGSGTFTGALSGTSATFSGNVTINNNNWLNFTDSTATSRNILTLASNDNLYLQYKAGSNFYLRNTDGDLRLTIASTGAATFSNLITVSGFGTSNFSSAGTGYNKLGIRNTTAGVANGAQLSIGTDADPDQLYIQSFATTFTTSGMNVAGGAVINGEGPGGLNLAATQANIGFYTNGAGSANLRMFISSSGTVGVGTSSPDYPLTIKTNAAAQSVKILARTSGDTKVGWYSSDNTTQYAHIDIGAAYCQLDASNSQPIDFLTNGTTRMTITSAGVTQITGQISATAAGSSNVASFSNGSSGYGVYIGAGSGANWNLYVASSAGVVNMYVAPNGYGYLLGSAWAYGSDIRMKENISDVQNGIDMVLKIKPKHFDYIDGQKNNIGFIAQDIQEIIPQAVSISNEETGMLALKTDFLVPYLVKAIQELTARVQYLENK